MIGVIEMENDESNRTCRICGRTAREPIAAVDMNIVYRNGERRNVRVDGFDGEHFCQSHFVRFVALKVEEQRRVPQMSEVF